MLFTWLLLAGFILLFSPKNLTNQFSFAFFRIFQWPLSIGRNFALSAPTQEPIEDVPDRELSKYKNHIANLEQTIKQQNQNFQKLFGLYNNPVWANVDLALAGVITATISGSRNELHINCRKTTGLAKGLFILADNSIVGTISDVLSHTAIVKLFTDSTSKVAVQIGDLEVPLMMHGNGNNTAKVMLLPRKYKVKKGDRVFVCRKPGFIDAPMIIGQITECKRDSKEPLLWDITVKPACDVENLKEVYVIIMNPQK
jgi:rod shape-determining protein MreC